MQHRGSSQVIEDSRPHRVVGLPIYVQQCVQEVQSSDWTASTSADRVSVMSRVRHQVRGEQQRWKGAVQEQRRHIYDHHTMLN